MSDKCGHPTNDGGQCSFNANYPDGKCGHHTTHTEQNGGKTSKLAENEQVIELVGEEIQRGATIPEALSEVEEKTGVFIARGTHDSWMAKGKQEDGKEIYTKYRSEVRRARNIAARADRTELKRECQEKGDTRTWWKVHQQQYGDLYESDSEADEDRGVRQEIPEDLVSKWYGRNR